MDVDVYPVRLCLVQSVIDPAVKINPHDYTQLQAVCGNF